MNVIEVLGATAYYGKHARGTVVLVNGCPVHFTGKGSRSAARAFVAYLLEV